MKKLIFFNISLGKFKKNPYYYIEIINDNKLYPLNTIKDNIALFSAEILEKISKVLVNTGHSYVGHKKNESLKGRYGSFVVETNVHYPTDINLLFDSIQKVIKLMASNAMLRWRCWHETYKS